MKGLAFSTVSYRLSEIRPGLPQNWNSVWSNKSSVWICVASYAHQIPFLTNHIECSIRSLLYLMIWVSLGHL